MFEWITKVVATLGYTGVAALTFLENVFPPIPSEVVIPLAGYVAAEGNLRIGMVIAAGSAGSLLGAALWYEAARHLGERRLRTWVERHGRWVTLGVRDVEKSQAWFKRHGNTAVLIGRLVPGVRTLVSVPAGFAGMRRGPFLVYSAAGTVVWTAALAGAGLILKSQFALVGDYINTVTNVLFGCLGVWLAWRYYRCWRP
jgi:membrane protein DedA with SNARE-associated domain